MILNNQFLIKDIILLQKFYYSKHELIEFKLTYKKWVWSPYITIVVWIVQSSKLKFSWIKIASPLCFTIAMCNCFCNMEKEVLSSSIQPPPRVPKISPKNYLMCPAYISMKVLKIWSWFYLREVHGSVSIFFQYDRRVIFLAFFNF